MSTNTAIGLFAIGNITTGTNNIALGRSAGAASLPPITLFVSVQRWSNVSNSCYIGQIFGATSAGGIAILVNSDGKLGTIVSSRRFKEEIQPMEQASETLFALKPVTFCYKGAIDPAGISQFGLVAEEVEKVNPDLVVRDKEGKPYSVRYDQVNAMLLNEFLKEHRKNEETRKPRSLRLQKQVETLTAGLQKVNAQIELNNAAPQTVLNNH